MFLPHNQPLWPETSTIYTEDGSREENEHNRRTECLTVRSKSPESHPSSSFRVTFFTQKTRTSTGCSNDPQATAASNFKYGSKRAETFYFLIGCKTGVTCNHPPIIRKDVGFCGNFLEKRYSAVFLCNILAILRIELGFDSAL